MQEDKMSTTRSIKVSFIAACLVLLAAAVGHAQSDTSSSQVDEKNYVGNVYGTVIDAQTGQPLQGVEVVLTGAPLLKGKSTQTKALISNKGYVVVPQEFYSSNLRAFTDEKGEFLINSVPTPYPEKPYTIIATSAGYVSQILDQVPVRPGAVMSLHVTVSLERGNGKAKVFDKGDKAAPFKYHDEEPVDVPSADVSSAKAAQVAPYAVAIESRSIFATREGLVGQTTANGHVIQSNDHFVALPSGTVLAKNWHYEFQVRLTYKGRIAVVPVWDVGPQNHRDDYWNPSAIRAMWRDLAQGVPEVQAAYLNGYNGGKDENGEKLPNPAGIDIADGTFKNDLKLPTNDWVGVEYLWTTGHADFSVSRTPDVASIVRGASASFQVTVGSSDGFTSPVTLSVSGLPAGASVTSPQTAKPPLNGSDTKTFTISTGSLTQTGSFSLTFSATCGALTKRVSTVLIVNPPPPPPGTVKVVATLNGRAWSGPVNYNVAGPSGVLIRRSVSDTTTGLTPGRYSIGSVSGGPGTLSSVSPSTTQTLNPGGTITFTLNFRR
jgi:VCBS repeat-containing protein